MRKTLPYILLLIVLAFGVWFLLFKDKNEDFSNSEAGFTIKDTATVSKIFLAKNDGEILKLERKDGGWIINGQYPALQSRVNMLLRTFHEQTAQNPVPEAMHNNIVRSFIGLSTKVEVYDHEGRKMRVFFVGGESGNSKGANGGTYMLMEGAKRPYVVVLPGFEGYVTPRYEPELKGWRDRKVSNIAPEHIQEVSISYVREPLNTFSLTQKNGQVKVALDNSLLMNDKPLNQRRVKAYLGFFENLNLEEYVNGQYQLDSMIKAMPKICTMDIRSDNGFHQNLDVYYFPQTKRSKNQTLDSTELANNYDADRFYGVMNNGKDTITIQNSIFEKIFRRGYEFFMPDQPVPEQKPAPGTYKK